MILKNKVNALTIANWHSMKGTCNWREYDCCMYMETFLDKWILESCEVFYESRFRKVYKGVREGAECRDVKTKTRERIKTVNNYGN